MRDTDCTMVAVSPFSDQVQESKSELLAPPTGERGRFLPVFTLTEGKFPVTVLPTRDSSWPGPSYLHHNCQLSAPVASHGSRSPGGIWSLPVSLSFYIVKSETICLFHFAHSWEAAATCRVSQAKEGSSAQKWWTASALLDWEPGTTLPTLFTYL